MIDANQAFQVFSVFGIMVVLSANLIRLRSFAFHLRFIGIALYFSFVFAITFFPFPSDVPTLIAIDAHDSKVEDLIQLIPFDTIGAMLRNGIHDFEFVNIFGNIVLLAPLGYIVGRTGKRLYAGGLLSGVLASLAIELGQLFMNVAHMLMFPRTFDVDDIILNSFGFVVGYLLSTLNAKAVKLEA